VEFMSASLVLMLASGRGKIEWKHLRRAAEFQTAASQLIRNQMRAPLVEGHYAATTKMVALAIAVIVAFSSLSVAQYHDDDDDGGYHQSNPRQARQYGYRQGYRDGYAKGRHEGRENDPNDYQSPDWRQATRGYEQWMGAVETFQNGYRDGYGSGFQAGYQSLNGGWGDGDEDRDRGRYNRGGDVYDQPDFGYGSNMGY
jgi:hypothetical protein